MEYEGNGVLIVRYKMVEKAMSERRYGDATNKKR